MKHEVLGHYGLNTLAPEHKRALLSGILEARDEPSLEKHWASIARRYPEYTPLSQAEEVFALLCEDVHDPLSPEATAAAEAGMNSFTETCWTKSRLVTKVDLVNMTHLVANQLQNPDCVPLTSPGESDEPPPQENVKSRRIADSIVALVSVKSKNRSLRAP